MISEAFVYRTDATVPGLYESFFGGLFNALGAPMMAQALILTTVPLAILFAGLNEFRPRKRFVSLSQFFSVATYLLLCFFLTQPWDELFVNLKHSFNLMNSGVFSFNRLTPIEGTVDFLPYYLIGILGKLGLPIVEMAFLQSYIGGALTIGVGVKCLEKWKAKGASTWGCLFLSTFAPLALNAGNGFVATTLTFFLLIGVFYLFFDDKTAVGLFFLAIAPLVRLEASLALILLWGLWISFLPSSRIRNAGETLWIFVPLILLSVWRFKTFGSVWPVPILFKATSLHLFYLIVGIRNLLADMVTGAVITSFIAIALVWTAALNESKKFLDREKIKLLWLTGCFLLFCAPYYSSGGDWLPRYWGRYLLPFSTFVALVGFTFLSWGYTHLAKSSRNLILGLVTSAFVSQLPWFFSSYRKMVDDVFTHKKTMANAYSRKTGDRHYRIENLSQLGHHLKETTEPTAVIGSSEVATIMYFAERETIDLLGVANPQIANAPLRLPRHLVRPWENHNELPYLIFRRIVPDLIAEKQPEILYTFDFFLRDIMPEIPIREVTNEELLRALNRWEDKFKGLNGPLYGGIPKIISLGYEPIVVIYANDFCALYFVSSKEAVRHRERLVKLGFKESHLVLE